jgi:serine/threonine protein kinase
MRKTLMHKVGIMQQQESPYILQVFAFQPPGDGEGACYALLEFATGGDIRTRAKSLSLEEKAAAIASIIAALKHLHGKGFVHGDVAPGNLLVGKFGVRLCDFGTAKIADETVTHCGMTVGYAAPETMNDAIVTDKSDVFSAALVIAYVINGEHFIKEGTPLLRAGQLIVNGGRPPLPAKVRPELKRLLERMWATNPDERPTSAEVWDELAALHFACFAQTSGVAVKRLLGLVEPSPPPTGGAAELTALRREVAKLRRECDSKAAAAASAQKDVADLKKQIGSLRADFEMARRRGAAGGGEEGVRCTLRFA